MEKFQWIKNSTGKIVGCFVSGPVRQLSPEEFKAFQESMKDAIPVDADGIVSIEVDIASSKVHFRRDGEEV